VLVIALLVLAGVRRYYMDIIETLFPQMADSNMLPAIGVGLLLFVIVSVLNIVAIRRKVSHIWSSRE